MGLKGYFMKVRIESDRMGNLQGSAVSEKQQKDLEEAYGTSDAFAQEGMQLWYDVWDKLSDGARNDIQAGWGATVNYPIDEYWAWVEFHRTEDSHYKNPKLPPSANLSRKVKEWMAYAASSGDYSGFHGGEVNRTKLAEDAAQEYDLYEGANADIPEWVFDAAHEVAEVYGTGKIWRGNKNPKGNGRFWAGRGVRSARDGQVETAIKASLERHPSMHIDALGKAVRKTLKPAIVGLFQIEKVAAAMLEKGTLHFDAEQDEWSLRRISPREEAALARHEEEVYGRAERSHKGNPNKARLERHRVGEPLLSRDGEPHHMGYYFLAQEEDMHGRQKVLAYDFARNEWVIWSLYPDGSFENGRYFSGKPKGSKHGYGGFFPLIYFAEQVGAARYRIEEQVRSNIRALKDFHPIDPDQLEAMIAGSLALRSNNGHQNP